jgi:exodeoxyribonuclease VII small subunit
MRAAPKVGGVSDAVFPERDEPRPTYEQAREELVDVVRRLETGAATLEESLALWERGEALAAICQQWLDGARARLDEAVTRDRGEQPSA